MVCYPVLHTPNWSRQFVLKMDASGFTLEAVIMQEYEDGLHPVAFHSRSLLPAERNYDTHDKKLLGIIFAFKHARPFFPGASHTIRV
jgi:hypothetical protein